MKEMYKGKVNSPATLLVETIDSSVTSIKVADGTVFPEGPNVAVIGTDGNAETIKYNSINGNILVGCVRGFQGKASVWDKDTIIARNFTEYDLDALQENILELDKKELKDFQEDENHRTVTDSEKEKWNKKVDQSQITGDANASGSDKVWNVDFLQKQFGMMGEVLDSKIDESNITDIFSGSSSNLVLSQNGARNLYYKVVDDFNVSVDRKADKSEIPTKISQLTNDKNFKTETEIKTLINNSTKLKKEVITSLPATGKEDIIYLLKNKNDTNNYYTEYMWISGKWEIIGDTKVDLTGYPKKTEVVTSVNGKKGNIMVDFFVGDDTRDKNYAPKDYLERGVRYKSYTNSQFEFKRCPYVGVDRLITQDYCIVNTQVPWADKSGGLPMQIAYGKGVMAIRTAKDENTWGEWQKVSTSSDLTDYAKSTDVPTRLSQLLEDSTHKTVTDSEKQKWNKKFDLPVGKENQVLTKTTNGAEFKNISSSRSATFVIANYDSSENSKAGADYVIQESDCAAEIINSFITKLPEYGGKIQLTEGNFNIKKPISINFTKNNIIIEGYGNSTNIIDKLTKDERNSVIINISTGITNCRLSDLNITHESSNSINIRGNKNHIKNVNIINNGSHPSIYFNDNTSGNILENCNIKCDSSYSYWIGSTSESNTLLRCVGESSSENATLF